VYHPTCRSPNPAETYVAPQNTSVSQKVLEMTGAYTPAVGATQGAFDVFFEVEHDPQIAMELATRLRHSQWIDSATSVLQIETLALNAESAFFAVVKMTFTFRFDGVVDRNIQTRTLQVITGISIMEYIPEFVWVFLITWLLLQELRQVLRMCWQRKLGHYFSDVWNVVDWISIVLGFGLIGVYVIIVLDSVSLAGQVITLPRAPLPANVDLSIYRTDWTSVIAKAEALYVIREGHLFFLYIYSSIITLRFLKGFLGQQKLAMIQFSLARSSSDVFHFQIVFGIIFITFVIGGHVLFGVALQEWSTVPNALSSTIKMLMGAFEFEAMYDYAPWSATVWFWLFLFSMVFLLLKLFTSVLVYHFSKFRKIVGPTDTIFTDTWDGIRDLLWRCEWRKDNIMDRDFMNSLANPYEDLMEGLAEKAKITDEMSEMMESNVLGIRMARSRQDARSLNGLKDDLQEHPSAMLLKEKEMQRELRTVGCDATTADHLIDECDMSNKKHERWNQKLQHMDVEKARGFLKMLRIHQGQLSEYCDQIENGVAEEMTNVIDGLEVLEKSIEEAFDGLRELRLTEVDSLALCPARLPYAGTTIRDTFQNSLGHQPPRKGTAAVPGRGDLRSAAEADNYYALDNGVGNDMGPAPPALMDNSQGGSRAYPPQSSQLALPGMDDRTFS